MSHEYGQEPLQYYWFRSACALIFQLIPVLIFTA